MLTDFSGEWLIYRDLAIALAAGLLIGVERGWTLRDEHKGARVSGIRTFALIAGLGGLVALISQSLNLIIAAILLAGVVTMLSVSHFKAIHDPDGRSITNFVVSLLTLGERLSGAGDGRGRDCHRLAVDALRTARTVGQARIDRYQCHDPLCPDRSGSSAVSS